MPKTILLGDKELYQALNMHNPGSISYSDELPAIDLEQEDTVIVLCVNKSDRASYLKANDYAQKLRDNPAFKGKITLALNTSDPKTPELSHNSSDEGVDFLELKQFYKDHRITQMPFFYTTESLKIAQSAKDLLAEILSAPDGTCELDTAFIKSFKDQSKKALVKIKNAMRVFDKLEFEVISFDELIANVKKAGGFKYYMLPILSVIAPSLLQSSITKAPDFIKSAISAYIQSLYRKLEKLTPVQEEQLNFISAQAEVFMNDFTLAQLKAEEKITELNKLLPIFLKDIKIQLEQCKEDQTVLNNNLTTLQSIITDFSNTLPKHWPSDKVQQALILENTNNLMSKLTTFYEDIAPQKPENKHPVLTIIYSLFACISSYASQWLESNERAITEDTKRYATQMMIKEKLGEWKDKSSENTSTHKEGSDIKPRTH